MAALTADKVRDERSIQEKTESTFSVATSATVYVGSLLNFNTAGRVVAATAAASRRFAGVCEAIVNETASALTAATGNTAGTVKVRVSWGHEVLGCRSSSFAMMAYGPPWSGPRRERATFALAHIGSALACSSSRSPTDAPASQSRAA